MGEIIAYTACFSSYFCLKKPSSPVPGTGIPQLSPFPFVLSELFTRGGWGLFLLLPEPRQQSKAGDVPGPQRSHPTMQVLWWCWQTKFLPSPHTVIS